MIELEYNPQIGEQVEILGRDGLFEILDRFIGPEGNYMLRVRALRDGRLLDVLPISTDYPSAERVRRALMKIAQGGKDWPEDFQAKQFDVITDKMYDDTPRIMVYFYLKPEATPSASRARIWNDFYAKLQEKLQPMVDSGIWLQFTAKEGRNALSVAS